jgi:hypothetical protein
MKKITILFVILTFVMSMSLMAEVKNDILYIPKTSMAPIIDGVMDSVYQNHAKVLLIKEDPSDGTTIDNWFDSFGGAHLLWDDTYLYLFLDVHDDWINSEGGDHNYDGVEIYFDGDDSKAETYDGLDDIQLRFNVGETETDQIDTGFGSAGASWDFDKSVFEFIIEETDMGWVLEFAVPYEDLLLAPGSTFGFDMQINDADESTREHMLRWWQDADNANDAWQNASLFGTAMMRTDRVVSDILDIPATDAAPTIDGVMADGEWADSWQVSSNIFDSALDVNTVEDWSDMRYTANLMWKDEQLFLFLDVTDDVINAEGGDYNYDGVEIYFDGDNSKGLGDAGENTYDGFDDIQQRFNVGEFELDQVDVGFGASGGTWDYVKDGIEYIIEETDNGWALEVSWNVGDLQIEAGSPFGFDMQLNDADDVTRGDNMMRWWSDSNNQWQNSAKFGTANLLVGTAVKENAPTVASTFDLAQNYPNPFNPTTTISYSLAKAGQVELTVFNLLGKEVASLANEVQEAGVHNVTFDASNLTSGVYFYTLRTEGQTFTNKMMLMK